MKCRILRDRAKQQAFFARFLSMIAVLIVSLSLCSVPASAAELTGDGHEQTDPSGFRGPQDVPALRPESTAADGTAEDGAENGTALYSGMQRTAGIRGYNGVSVLGFTFTDKTVPTTEQIGGGTVTWDPDAAELTLENVNISDPYAYIGIIATDSTQTVTLTLKGTNVIDASGYTDMGVLLEANCNFNIKTENGAVLNLVTGDQQNAIYNYGGSMTIGGSGTIAVQAGSYPAIFGGSDVSIEEGRLTVDSAGYGIYSESGDIHISGGQLTVNSTAAPAIYAIAGNVQIKNAEVHASGYYAAICGTGAVNIQGGSVTAEAENDTAIFSPGNIQISRNATVDAKGYGAGCAVYTQGRLNISSSTVIGHSDANHVIAAASGPMGIENADLTLTSDADVSGLFLIASQPLSITADSSVRVTTGGSSIVSNGDVSVTDSRLTIKSGGNGIVAAVEESGGAGTLLISGTTHIESESQYPLTGFKVEMTGGYVKSVTSSGPAISATRGITVSGGEIYAESTGSNTAMEPAGLYSRKGEIRFTGENTKVQAVSGCYCAVYNKEGTIYLNADVLAKAGKDQPAFKANAVTNDTTSDPAHNIVIGDRFSAMGYVPVTTKWKNGILINNYGNYAYTVLAPVGTENLQDDYLDVPSEILVTDCEHKNTELRNAAAADCQREGYSGDVYCGDCGMLLKKGNATPTVDHNWQESIIRQPTASKEGLRRYTCVSCKASYEETIPKLPAGSQTPGSGDTEKPGTGLGNAEKPGTGTEPGDTDKPGTGLGGGTTQDKGSGTGISSNEGENGETEENSGTGSSVSKKNSNGTAVVSPKTGDSLKLLIVAAIDFLLLLISIGVLLIRRNGKENGASGHV